MGLASEADWQELEQMSKAYPEVKEARERFEQEQESLHLSNPVAPPPALKQQLLQSLEFAEEKTPVVTLPEAAVHTKPQAVPLLPTPKPMKWLQRAVAVSVLLLMGSILLNFYFYSKSVSYRKQYDALVIQQNSLLAKNETIEASVKMIKDPAVKKITMDATPMKPGSMATVYWDSRSKDVYLMVNNLPKTAPDKHYVLWAIVDGKPENAGMLNMEEDSVLHKMSNTPNAQAFAITLEKNGNTETPTMDAMYVFGKI